MNSQELRSLQEAYLDVCENSLLNALGNVGGAVERAADTYVKPNLERIGAQKGKEKVGPLGNIPGVGAAAAEAGRRTASSLYDQGKNAIKTGNVNDAIKTGRTALDMLKQSYEYDLFDYILEYLVAEGYADTNENAIAIMSNMSEEWRQSIVEDAPLRDEPLWDMKGDKPKPPVVKKPQPQVKTEPPMRDKPLW